MGDPSAADPLDAELCLSFLTRQAWIGMRNVVHSVLAEHRLSVPQYAALLVLVDQPGISLSDLARVVGGTRQSTTELVAGMEREGLVERRQHPENRRSHQVWLSEEGKARLSAAKPAVRAKEALLEESLSDEARRGARIWLQAMAEATPGT